MYLYIKKYEVKIENGLFVWSDRLSVTCQRQTEYRFAIYLIIARNEHTPSKKNIWKFIANTFI